MPHQALCIIASICVFKESYGPEKAKLGISQGVKAHLTMLGVKMGQTLFISFATILVKTFTCISDFKLYTLYLTSSK